MWVFGYGSLIWDGWEDQFGGARHDNAMLRGYRRCFSKASTRNWGSPSAPCPTLGLAADHTAACQGVVFEFEAHRECEVLDYLRQREGKSFVFAKLDVALPSGTLVEAFVPINNSGATDLSATDLKELAAMAKRASGREGTCAEYVSRLRAGLRALDITDRVVDEFDRLVSGDGP